MGHMHWSCRVKIAQLASVKLKKSPPGIYIVYAGTFSKFYLCLYYECGVLYGTIATAIVAFHAPKNVRQFAVQR